MPARPATDSKSYHHGDLQQALLDEGFIEIDIQFEERDDVDANIVFDQSPRAGILLAEPNDPSNPIQLLVSYRCSEDGSGVEFVGAKDTEGESRDPYDVHNTTLEDAFKMHWESRTRLGDLGFEVFADRAERIDGGIGCVVSKPSEPGVPKLFEPVRVSFKSNTAEKNSPGIYLEFDQLEQFLNRLTV